MREPPLKMTLTHARSPHLSERNLLRLQAASGSLFAIFLLVHVLNTSAASLGPTAYDDVQTVARGVYQHPAIELGLIALPLLAHAWAALVRLRRSGFRRPNQSTRARLHRFTGYYLLLVVGGHVWATRGPSLFLDFHPGSPGLAFSLWWQPWIFYPYYTLFLLSAIYHLSHGLTIAISTLRSPLPDGLRRGPGFWLPVAGLSATALMGLVGLAGWLYEIPDPTDNEYARMWESFGVDLQRPSVDD